MKWLASAIVLALGGCASVPGAMGPTVAITVDDLPVHGEMPPDETPITVARGVISALQAEGISTAYGFVNGERIEREPDTLEVLTAWRRGGLPLANHGWAHRHLNAMTAEEFEQEVAKNEPLLGRLMSDGEWRWFRYPFLDEGESPEKRAAGRRVLAARGYRIAPVTMDFSDWQWTGPYARCKRSGNEAAIDWLERSFLHSAHESIGFYRALSHGLYGRDIPYVLLLHISAFEGRMLPRLLQLYRQQGFRFVSLDRAASDPAYTDQANPAAPPLAQGLEGKARGNGIPLPPRTDYSKTLDAICR